METSERLSLAEIAAKVDFSTEQLARMCAVSRRQLSYWTQKGIIPAQGSYNLATVEKVILIRRQLAAGSSLRRAVDHVERRLGEFSRFETAAKELPAEQADGICAAQLARIEDALRSIQAALPNLAAEERRQVAARLAALQLEQVLDNGIAALPASDLLVALGRAVQHLELLREDLRAATVEV